MAGLDYDRMMENMMWEQHGSDGQKQRSRSEKPIRKRFGALFKRPRSESTSIKHSDRTKRGEFTLLTLVLACIYICPISFSHLDV